MRPEPVECCHRLGCLRQGGVRGGLRERVGTNNPLHRTHCEHCQAKFPAHLCSTSQSSRSAKLSRSAAVPHLTETRRIEHNKVLACESTFSCANSAALLIGIR